MPCLTINCNAFGVERFELIYAYVFPASKGLVNRF